MKTRLAHFTRGLMLPLCLAGLALFTLSPACAQDDDDNALVQKIVDIVQDAEAEQQNSAVDRARVNGKGEERREAKRIVSRLNSQRLSVNFEKTGLLDALDFIRTAAGFNVVITKEVRELIASENLKVNLKLNRIKLRNLLKLTLDNASGELCFSIYKGILMISTKEQSKGRRLKLRVYDLSDLIHKPKDFPAPDAGLRPKQDGNN